MARRWRKMRRPALPKPSRRICASLSHLAYLVELEFPDTRRYQPGEMISRFAKSLRRELDLAGSAIWALLPSILPTTR